MSVAHVNRDPMTGACLDCGARLEQIDDNVFPTCEKITGPHRLAIMAVRLAAAEVHWRARMTRTYLQQAENQVVAMTRQLRDEEAAERELNASLDMLREASGMKKDGEVQSLDLAISQAQSYAQLGPLPDWPGLGPRLR